MSSTKHKPSTPQPPPSSRPQLPLAVLESVAEIERRTKRLLERCRPSFSLLFNMSKATEILRTCAVGVFDQQADHYASLKAFVPQWLDELAELTVLSTLGLIDDLYMIGLDRPMVEQELRRTLQAHMDDRLSHAALERPAEACEESVSTGGDGNFGSPQRTATVASRVNEMDCRALIDDFISKVSQSGRKITRTVIWTIAGYRDATEFQRFQRGDTRTTQSAAAAFNRVLSMKPQDFIELLDKKSSPK